MEEKTNNEKRLDNVNGVMSFATILLLLGLITSLVYSIVSRSIVIFFICFSSSVIVSAVFIAIAALIDRQNAIIKLLRGTDTFVNDPGAFPKRFAVPKRFEKMWDDKDMI